MSTLWHPPAIRSGEHKPGSAVTWTELFYDLIFVVAIYNLGEWFVAAPTAIRTVEFVGLFGMVWWAWVSLTFLVDRYQSNDALDRLLAILQMLGVAGFSAAVARKGSSLDTIAVAIAASYALTRLGLLGQYARAWWHIPESRALVGGYLRGFGLDTLIWIVSIAVPSPARYALWALAMVVALATPWLMRREQARSPLDTSHLPERFGVFTILVLGEPITAVVYALHSGQVDTESVVTAAAAFMVATGLWWIYFDHFEGSIVRRDATRRHDWRPTTWIYAHYPFALGVTTVGAAMAHIVSRNVSVERHLAITLGVGMAGALLAMTLILISQEGVDAASRRRQVAARIVGAAVAAGVAALVAAGRADMSPAVFVGALAVVLAVQVVRDLVEPALWPSAAAEVDIA
jgi:low temperature requirement protein LtrA